MSHQGRNGRGGWLAGLAPRAVGLSWVIVAWGLGATGTAQVAPAGPAQFVAGDRVVEPAPPAPRLEQPGVAPGTAVAGPEAAVGAATPAGPAGLDPDVQVVRFQGPPGLNVEVLAPNPTPVPVGRRRRNYHRRPQAWRGIPAADHQHP